MKELIKAKYSPVGEVSVKNSKVPGLKLEKPNRKVKYKLLKIQLKILKPEVYQQIKIKEMCYFMLARIKLTTASGNAVTVKNKLARADFPFKFSFDENK